MNLMRIIQAYVKPYQTYVIEHRPLPYMVSLDKYLCDFNNK